MREDGLALLDRFRGRIPNLFSNYYRLEHLDRAAAERAIRKPLDRYNASSEPSDADVSIEDSLVNTLVKDVRVRLETKERDEGNDIKIETPLLQMVLERMWYMEMDANSNTLCLTTYTKLGGAGKSAVDTLSMRWTN